MLRATALSAAVLLLLTGCSGDGATKEGDTEPVEVEVGKAFSWNGFSVADGWRVDKKEMNRADQQGTMPLVTGDITNDGETTRFALLQLTFLRDGSQVASVPCVTDKLKVGESEPMECSGLSSSYPEDYDEVRVSEIQR